MATEFQEKMKEQLEEGIKNIYKSDEWANYLKLYRNFANLSYNNKILVFIQNPNASIIKTANAWKKDYERYIEKGQKAIYICRPNNTKRTYTTEEILERLEKNPDSEYWKEMFEKAQESGGVVQISYATYSYIPEFDVSQTNGKELPPHMIREALKDEYSDAKEVIDCLTDFAVSNEYVSSVSFKDVEDDSSLANAYGYYRPSTKEIVLRNDMSESMTVKVLIHEIAHSMLHGKEMFEAGLDNTSFINKRDIKEIQAESVAYVVCQDLGIDSSKESFGYIAEYANEDMNKLKSNLDIIDKCAVAIIDNLNDRYKEKEGLYENDLPVYEAELDEEDELTL